MIATLTHTFNNVKYGCELSLDEHEVTAARVFELDTGKDREDLNEAFRDDAWQIWPEKLQKLTNNWNI